MIATQSAAQPAPSGTCADFSSMGEEQKAELAFLSEQWVAGFHQAKFLSCVSAQGVPTSAAQEKMLKVECKLRDASQTYLALSLDTKKAKLGGICKAFPENDLTRNLMLVLADLAKDSDGQP